MTAPPAVDVSIVICTRNRATALAGTIDSLRSLQSRFNWEAIIVDNASTDETEAVLRGYAERDDRIAWTHCARIGLGAARDHGWRRTKGRIVAFTDDDCLVAPDFVDALVAAFADHPTAGCIGGRIEQFNAQHIRVTIDERTDLETIVPRSFVPTGALHGANLAFRRAALEAVGGIDPLLGAGTPFPCEDVDAVARIVWAGFDAVFDPRPRVQHDHRRTEAHRTELMRSYDRGRGAYLAKFAFGPDSGATYRQTWLAAARRSAYPAAIDHKFREIVSGFAYLRRAGSEHLPGFLWLAVRLMSLTVSSVVMQSVLRRFPLRHLTTTTE